MMQSLMLRVPTTDLFEFPCRSWPIRPRVQLTLLVLLLGFAVTPIHWQQYDGVGSWFVAKLEAQDVPGTVSNTDEARIVLEIRCRDRKRMERAGKEAVARGIINALDPMIDEFSSDEELSRLAAQLANAFPRKAATILESRLRSYDLDDAVPASVADGLDNAVVAELIGLSRLADSSFRVAAARVLSLIGARVREFTRECNTFLSDAEALVRFWTLVALGNARDIPCRDVPALLQCLVDSDVRVRGRAARVLAESVPCQGDEVERYLKDRAKNDDEISVALWATIALKGQLLDDELIPILNTATSNPEVDVRRLAARAASLARPSKRVATFLLELIQGNNDSSILRVAIDSLKNQDCDAELNDAIAQTLLAKLNVIRELISTAKRGLADHIADDYERAYSCLMQKLGDIDPTGRTAIVAVLSDLESKSLKLRLCAVATLRTRQPVSQLGVDALCKALSDTSNLVRLAAIGALGTYNARATAAYDRIKYVSLNDPDAIVRDEAHKLIGHLETQPKRP